MADFETEAPGLWVPLRQASKQMGVSPATLRVWADEGRVPTYRTPGGHRRFRVGAPMALARMHRRSDTRWRLLEHSVLGRIRLSLELETTEPRTFSAVNSQARTHHRELGRALTHLLVQGLESEQKDFAAGAAELGKQYAALHQRYRVTGRDALSWLAFFRNSIVESVIEFAFGLGEPTADQLIGWLRRVNELIDHVCLAMLEASAGTQAANVRER